MGSPAVSVTNNILYPGTLDWSCLVAPNTKSACWLGYVASNNVLIDLDGINPTGYTNSFDVNTEAGVGFVGFTVGNYRLSSTSPYRAAASDGTAIGCNIDTLEVAIGVSLGNGTDIPTGPGTVFTPADGTALQAALDAAVPGDTIILTAGATYTGPGVFYPAMTARAKGSSSTSYITVKSSQADSIAIPVGLTKTQRDSWLSLYGPKMAKIRGRGGAPALQVEALAKYYKFIGLDISTTGENPSSVYAADLVDVAGNGTGEGGYTTIAERLGTHHNIFDRCFIHPAEVTYQNQRSSVNYRTSGRGVQLSGQYNSVINCDIRGFGGLFYWDNSVIDSYGVYTSVLPTDNITVENNYIEAHTMTVFAGGGGSATPNSATVSSATSTHATLSTVANLAVGDLLALKVATYAHPAYGYDVRWQTGRVTNIVGNVVTYTAYGATGIDRTPLMPGLAQWNGYHNTNYTVRHNLIYKLEQAGGKKGYLELKDCVGGLIEGNVFDGEWASDAALTPRNQDGGAPWSQTSNIIFRNNKGYFSRFFTVVGSDSEQSSEISENVTIENNLGIMDINEPFTTHSILCGSCDSLTYRHNTIIEPQSSNSIVFTAGLTGLTNFTFEDNIGSYGSYGWSCQIAPYTSATCWPIAGLVKRKNVYIADNPDAPTTGEVLALHPNDFAVATKAAVGFVNPYTAGGVGHHFDGDWRLSPTSIYNNAAHDFTDIGCNIDAMEAAQA